MWRPCDRTIADVEGLRSRIVRAGVRATLVIATMSLVVGTLASPGSAAPSPSSVPSPVSGGWQLNGTAQLVTTASPANLQLTPATNYQVGSAFWPTPVPGVGISASFDAFIGPGSGADGMTFTLADAAVTKPTALGVNGGGEGFAGITGIAVSLDTWKNTQDPSKNFVGIATTSPRTQSLSYAATNSSIPALRNSLHHFAVTTSSTGMTVTMDGTQVLNYTTSLPSSVLVGFTGATGGFNDVHRVENVSITAGPPPPAPTVTGVSPSSGPTAGGTTVTITGTELHRRVGGEVRRHRGRDLLGRERHHHHRDSPGGDGHGRRDGHDRRRHQRHGRRRSVTPTSRRRRPDGDGREPDVGSEAGGTTVTITGTELHRRVGGEVRRDRGHDLHGEHRDHHHRDGPGGDAAPST